MIIDKIRKLKKGDIVYISDELSLKKNNTVKPMPYTVEKIGRFTIPNQNIHYTIYDILDSNDGTLGYLILNESGNQAEFGLYFPVDIFPQGSNRQDLMASNDEWLFNPPKDVNNFKPSDLEFTSEIKRGDVIYSRKFPTIFGVYREDKPLFASLTEYEHKDKLIPNKDIVLFEIGGMDQDNNLLPQGGSIQLMHGRELKENDLDILLK